MGKIKHILKAKIKINLFQFRPFCSTFGFSNPQITVFTLCNYISGIFK